MGESNISISGVIGVCKPRDPGKRGNALREIRLGLVPRPTPAWAEIFGEIWASRIFYSLKRPACISGDAIVIECVPDELAEIHKPMLLDALAMSNEDHRKAIAVEQNAALRRAQDRETDKAILARLKDIAF